jgi:divalent metal cation (Fe/Co/Zn/Cd) transporter
MDDKARSTKGEKTLLAALLLSAPGPVVTGIAAVMSRSATQIADFIRRSMELVAIGASWWVFRALCRDASADEAARARLERIANMTVMGAMICSGVAMLIIGVFRLFAYVPGGNVILGLIIAVLGLGTNSWFCRRYKTLWNEQQSPVLAAQQRLYRAKSYVDLCVVAALLAVAIAPTHPATRYIDALGSIAVAVYMLWSGVKTARSAPAAKPVCGEG